MKKPVISGLMYSLIVLLIGTVVMSIFVYFTHHAENRFFKYAYFIHGLSLVIGGLIAGRRARMKGWYYGGMSGVFYCLIIILVGFLSYDAIHWMNILPLLLLGLIAGAFGGIIGVNTVK